MDHAKSPNSIKKFDKATVRTLHGELEAALKPIAARLGLDLVQNGGSYEDVQCTLRFKLFITDQDARLAAGRETVGKFGGLYGLKPEHVGIQFKATGKLYEFVTLSVNRSKFPLECREIGTGKAVFFHKKAASVIAAAAEAATGGRA